MKELLYLKDEQLKQLNSKYLLQAIEKLFQMQKNTRQILYRNSSS